VREHGRVIVGDVNAAGLAKTRMAKSVLDAGWSMFREQLRYKALRHGVAFEVVSEKWTTQTCSDRGTIGGAKVSQALARGTGLVLTVALRMIAT